LERGIGKTKEIFCRESYNYYWVLDAEITFNSTKKRNDKVVLINSEENLRAFMVSN